MFWPLARLLAVTVTALVVHQSAVRVRDAPALEPVASVRDLMRALVAPSADALFGSVSVTVNASGEAVRSPAEEPQWEELRGHALRLAEGASLLRMRGRPLGFDGSTDPQVPGLRIPARQVQRMIELDWPGWEQQSAALGRAAVWALQAIDARNADRLHATGGDLSLTCERCHLAYRHPDARIPPELEQ